MKLLSRDIKRDNTQYYAVVADGGLGHFGIYEKLNEINCWLVETYGKNSRVMHTEGTTVFFKYPEDRLAFILKWS